MPFITGGGVSRTELRQELGGAVAQIAQLIRRHGAGDPEEPGAIVDGLIQLHVKVDALDSKLDQVLWELQSRG